jgi:uncharacterized iron-regulated membrane protein
MNTKALRNSIFTLHRYLGLALGLIAIIIGLTGSLLVFHTEIANFDQYLQTGTITPVGEPLPVERVISLVKQAYADQPDVKFQRYWSPPKPDKPVRFILSTPASASTQVFVNPYTGTILNPNAKPSWIQTLFDVIYPLHYALLGGDIGTKFVGIIGLLFTILSITGIILWPGWRKLISGFKIKWNAHPKRVNFDIHKVAGVVTGLFLIFTFFTGFCWNLGDFANPIIYAITFSKPQENPAVAVPITYKLPLSLPDQLKIAQAAFPKASLYTIGFAETPEDPIWLVFNLPQGGEGDVTIEPSGKVQISTTETASLGDRFLNSFTTLHYGTFWGLPSRILYVFVGLAPLILFITSLVMWWYRRQATHKSRHLV